MKGEMNTFNVERYHENQAVFTDIFERKLNPNDLKLVGYFRPASNEEEEVNSCLIQRPSISVCTSGSFAMHVNSGSSASDVLLEENQAILMLPGSLIKHLHTHPFTSISIHFGERFIRYISVDFPGQNPDASSVAKLGAYCKSSHQISFEETFFVKKVVELLETLEGREQFENYASHFLKILLLKAEERLRNAEQSFEVSQSHFTFNAACAYIEKHYAQDISRKDIADYLHIHPNYLSRLFKQYSDAGIADMVKTLRLSRSRELLFNETLNVSEVAFQSGFNNVNHFISCFRKHYGQTPGAMRKTIERGKAK